MARPPQVIVYSRVSTDAQERDGTSLDTQERASLEFVQAAGWQVVECIRDTASGFTLDRPGIERLRQLLHNGADMVVAYAVDRLSRNQNHIGVLFDEVQQANARLEFVTEKFEDTAVGRFILNVRAFVAEVEREKIKERTSRGKAERARSGRIPQGTGKGIYGYRYSRETGTRELDSHQAGIITEIFARFCNGGSCNGIALDLNRRNEPALGGGVWYPLTIRRVLLNETYTGLTVYRRTRVTSVRDPRSGKKRRNLEVRDQKDWIEIDGATPLIISPSMFQRAQAILSDPARRLVGQPSTLYQLRGHIRCAVCGTPMVGQALQRGRFRYYRCRRSYAGFTDSKCASKYVPAGVLEGTVLDQINEVLARPDRIIDEAMARETHNHTANRLSNVLDSLGVIETQQKRLVRLYTSGTLPEDALAEECARLNAERQRLEQERHTLEASRQPAISLEKLRRQLPLVMAQLRAAVKNLEGEELSLLLRALDVQVTASRQQIQIDGVIPALPAVEGTATSDDLVTIERTWA